MDTRLSTAPAIQKELRYKGSSLCHHSVTAVPKLGVGAAEEEPNCRIIIKPVNLCMKAINSK